MNLRGIIRLTGPACVLAGLLAATSVEAHNWGCWVQPNRTVYAYNTAGLNSQANAALQEWNDDTILSIPRVNYHTEISVFDGYYGNTGWAGLASIESYSGCNILHGHARVNRSYSYTSNGYRGIFCQEVGHLFGLDHSNDGGCMGGGYYYSINTYYTVVQHNINDIYNKYINKPAARAEIAEPASHSPAHHDGVQAIAFWHERPQTIEEALDLSEAVVVGRVLGVRAGEDLVVPVDGLDDGVDRIPTRRVLIAVEEVLAGRMNARVVTLFQTGGEGYVVEEDPPYAEGERYVLFLTSAVHGTYRVIAPEGRLAVTDAGLVPASEREFLSDLRGWSVESLSGRVTAMAKTLGDGAAAASELQFRLNAVTPSASRTSVSYSLPAAGDVRLRVYDAAGRLLRTLVDERQEAARWYTVEWDGADARGRSVASGVYFLRLETSAGARSVRVARVR